MSREFLEGKTIVAPPPPKRITSADGSQSVDPEFLSDNSAFAPEHVAATFENLKTCRQNIADLCKELETLRNNAVQKGKLQELEEHFNKFEWI